LERKLGTMLKRLRVAYLGRRGDLGLPIKITKDKSGFDLFLKYSVLRTFSRTEPRTIMAKIAQIK